MAGSALGVGTARVGLAEITGFERSAVGEGISSHVPRAGAYGGQAAEVAVGVHTTDVRAGVDASVVHAGGLVAGALAVRRALGGADTVGIAVVASRALANSAMCRHSLAISADAAVAAGADALEVSARLLRATLVI